MALRLYERLTVGVLGCNCYIVGDPVTMQAIVIDPGGDENLIIDAVARHGLTIAAQIATHAHFDHVLAADAIRVATGAPFMLHSADEPILQWLGPSMQMFLGVQGPEAPQVDRTVADGDRVQVGEGSLTVIHTPGHSPGSIAILDHGQALYSGDTLFASGIGRTDLPGGSFEELEASVRGKLFVLGDMAVYPGHGEPTTIDIERVTNPFLGSSR